MSRGKGPRPHSGHRKRRRRGSGRSQDRQTPFLLRRCSICGSEELWMTADLDELGYVPAMKCGCTVIHRRPEVTT